MRKKQGNSGAEKGGKSAVFTAIFHGGKACFQTRFLLGFCRFFSCFQSLFNPFLSAFSDIFPLKGEMPFFSPFFASYIDKPQNRLKSAQNPKNFFKLAV